MFLTNRLVTLCVLTAALGGAAAAPLAVAPGPVAAAPAPAQDVCANGSPKCVQVTIAKMERRFEPLAKACSHQAVFSLAYLRTTQEYARAAAEPGFFQDVRFVNHEDAVFAQYYFDAYDAWAAGRRSAVPEAWRIAFDAAGQRKVSGSGNLLLGMSAHVNRDLPFVLEQLGLGLKSDHDKVNVFLRRVVKPLLAEEAARFDPTMDDDHAYGLSHEAFFKLLEGWRELAWEHAQQLVEARTPADRALVAAKIEADAAATATSLVLANEYKPGMSGAAERDAYCATHG